MILGFTKTKKFKDLSDEELKVEAKEMVMSDFADKMRHYYMSSGEMIPYSTILYDIIYSRYGFSIDEQLCFRNNSQVIKGSKIETNEIIQTIHYNLLDSVDKDDIHKWFGIGEFPFLNTKIYRYDGYDIITYDISR